MSINGSAVSSLTLPSVWRQPFKTAIAVVLCVLIVCYFHLPNLAFVAPVSALVVMTVYHQQTLARGIQRILGPAIATVIAILIMSFFKTWLLYVVCMALFIWIGGYFSALTFYPYSFLLGGIIGGVILGQGLVNPVAAYHLGIYFVEQCAIGVVVAGFVTYFIFPMRPETQVVPTLKNFYQGLADQLAGNEHLSVESFGAIKPMLMYCDGYLTDLQKSYYLHLAISAKLFYLHNRRIRRLWTICQAAGLPVELSKKAQALMEVLEMHYRAMPQAISPEKFNMTLTALRQAIELARQSHLFSEWETKSVIHFISLVRELEALGEAIFRENEITFETAEKIKKGVSVAEAPRIWPLQKEAVKHGFNLALSTLIMMTLIYYFQWPGDTQAIITAAIIAAQVNSGRAKHKLVLRILGIALGGAVGLLGLLLLGHLDSFFCFLAFFFVTTLIAARFVLSTDRVSYMALQAQIIMPLMLLTTLGPTTQLTLPIGRLEGVLTGGLISALVICVLSPISPWQQFQKKIARGFLNCKDLLEAFLKRDVTEEMLRKKMFGGLHGNAQFVRDIMDFNEAADRNALYELHSNLQICFEELQVFCHFSPVMAEEPLLTFLNAECQQILETLLQDYARVADLFLQSPSAESLKSNGEALLAKVDQWRKEKRTASYSLPELAHYYQWISALYHQIQAVQEAWALGMRLGGSTKSSTK